MDKTPHETVQPRNTYTFEAVPEDAETQEELNRRLRKPGEPGYHAPRNSAEPSNARPADGAASQ